MTDILVVQNKSLPHTEVSGNISLTVESTEMVILRLTYVRCEDEGAYRVVVNDGAIATIKIRLVCKY